MVCAHIRYTRAGTWNLSFFGGFPKFFSADDFVADFWHCAWCPHILIGVFGGRVLPGDPSWKNFGVPPASSRIWGPLKFHGNPIFKHISDPVKIGLIEAKIIKICSNSMNLIDPEHTNPIFFCFWNYMCLFKPPKKIGNIATPQPPKSSIIPFETPFFSSKW